MTGIYSLGSPIGLGEAGWQGFSECKRQPEERVKEKAELGREASCREEELWSVVLMAGRYRNLSRASQAALSDHC